MTGFTDTLRKIALDEHIANSSFTEEEADTLRENNGFTTSCCTTLSQHQAHTPKHHQAIVQKVTGRIKRPVNTALIKNKCWESNISPRYQPRCLG